MPEEELRLCRPERGSKLARRLLERVDGETAIALQPRTLVSWDYAQRMSGIEPVLVSSPA